jgi:hypothetical protein
LYREAGWGGIDRRMERGVEINPWPVF